MIVDAGHEFFNQATLAASMGPERDPSSLAEAVKELRRVNQAKEIRGRYEDLVDSPFMTHFPGDSVVDSLVPEPPPSSPSWCLYALKTADRRPTAFEQAVFLLTCWSLVRRAGSAATVAVSDHCEYMIAEIRKVRSTVMRRKPSERRREMLDLIDADLTYFCTASQVIAWSRRAMGLGV